VKSNPVVCQFSEYFLDFRESLIENLLLVCNAIIISRSTNLSVMKDYLPQLLENEQTVSCSHYKRLIRFFNISDSASNKLIDCILGMIYKTLSESVKYLILDGTQWKRGKKCVHLLTLCIVYHGIAIPIYWHQLNKKGGHSSEEDRQKLFTQACERYQLSGKILLADREFIGEKWLSFLVHNKIDFIIRMSKTCYKKPISESLGFVYSKLEKIVSKSTKTKKSVIKQFQMNGITYSIVMVKNDKDDPLEPLIYFISTLQDKTQILDGYRIRWQIEICFKHLKTNGFNLEDLNFRVDSKICLMVALVVMAYVLSICQGLETNIEKKKIYKDKPSRLAISYFKRGLSIIKAKAWSLRRFIEFLNDIFKNVDDGRLLYVQ
jgi:hypothetical protein